MKPFYNYYRPLMTMMFITGSLLMNVDASGQCNPCPAATAVEIGSTATAGANSYSMGQFAKADGDGSYSFGCKVSTDSAAEGNIVIGTGGAANFVNSINHSMMIGTRLYGSVPTIYVEDALASDEDFGNVGIGTVNPESRLHVYDEIRVGETSGANGNLVFNNSAGDTISFSTPASMSNQAYTLPMAEGLNGDVLTYNTGGQLTWSNGGTATDDWRLTGNNDADANSKLGTLSNFPLMVYAAGQERMRVTTNGNVGIGTATPEGNLHIMDENNTDTELIIEKADTKEGAILFDNAGTPSASIT